MSVEDGTRFSTGSASKVSTRSRCPGTVSAESAVPQAEQLYADAVGARHDVSTTCGSSICIHRGPDITRPGATVLVDRKRAQIGGRVPDPGRRPTGLATPLLGP